MSISEILIVERELATSVITPQCAFLTVSGHLQPMSAFHPKATLTHLD